MMIRCYLPLQMQALKALKGLHDSITAERRMIQEMHHVWHTVITPHQVVRGELAAWPHGTYPLRMIKFLGVFRPSLAALSGGSQS